MQAPVSKQDLIEVPDDVKAELTPPAAVKTAPLAAGIVPVPEDVLAEQDAEARAAAHVPGDDSTHPVGLDEDSER
jgi:hypothetical protein